MTQTDDIKNKNKNAKIAKPHLQLASAGIELKSSRGANESTIFYSSARVSGHLTDIAQRIPFYNLKSQPDWAEMLGLEKKLSILIGGKTRE